MKFGKIIILLGVIIVTISACEEQVLNKDPQRSFSQKDIWGDITLANHYLNGVYDGIGNWGIPDGAVYQLAGNATDEMLKRGGSGLWQIPQATITASNMGDYTKWTPAYTSIRKCNIFLQNIGKVPNVSEDEIKTLKAQVRFIRAKNYADLVNWHSWWEGDRNGVPIIKKPFNLDDEFEVQRASYSEVVDFIVSELDAIAEALPEQWPADEWGRVTKGAAFALKSEILLYAASKRHNPEMDQSKWQKASDAAKTVIDMNMYSLYPVSNWQDYANIFLDRTNNPEIILARPFDPAQLPNNWLDKYNSPNGYKGWGNSVPTQNIVDKFEMANGKKITDPTSGYDPQNPYKNRELRFKATIVYNGRMYRGRKVEAFTPGGKDSKEGIQAWNTSPTGYWLYKFMDESIDFGNASAPTPYIMFRLAEIYLNYAEAEYHLGNESVAREYVNIIRDRANLPDIQSSGDQLLQDIRHERTIEMVFEKDHRWNDVRRWEILPQTASQDIKRMVIKKDSNGDLSYQIETVLERNFDERIYSLPIPFDEITKSNLTQNPGY